MNLRIMGLSLLLLLFAGCQPCPSDGRWQPGSTGAEASAVPSAPTTRWLVTNTGGGEGQRGNDLRHRLFDAHFWDEKIGWTCGYGGAFRTEDGGLTWTRMKPPASWTRVEMSGPADVWLFDCADANPNRLWHTTDNGATWNEVLPGKLRIGELYGDLYCRNDQRWILCGDIASTGGRAISYRSRDGGRTWAEETFGGLLQSARRIAIPDANGQVVYVLGAHNAHPRLVRSGDGGGTWMTLSLPESSIDYGEFFFATPTMGWVAGTEGTILSTRDGGQTWQARRIPTDQPIMALWFDATGHGFAAVLNTSQERHRAALYETEDGGKSWTPSLGGAKHVDAFYSVGENTLWGVSMSTGQWISDLVIIRIGK